MEYYEKRYITKYDGSDITSFINDENNITLRAGILTYNKIILLGNPGVGKTTELNTLFDLLWHQKEETGIIPFFINLKYYKSNISFEALINNDSWSKFPQIIFILDGLDEIADIQDFISEFENFISKNKNRSIKYVISCRTNIYSKYLAKITGFQPFVLKSITIDQAKSILENKFNIKNIDERFFENIDTPFFLNLFAEYYKENRNIPQNTSQIWELFIDKALDNHKAKVIKRTVLNKPKSIKLLKLLSLVNELMQKNYTTDEELYEIIGDEYDEFIENPFLIKNEDSNYWSFLHRQIQEYFVAKCFVDKNFKEILDFIKIEDTQSVHPSLFNSLTFLLDIMSVDDPDYKKLLEWIKNNQIELLFKSDSNRLSKNIRIEVFQEYFQQECINKTLWISTRRTFEVSDIGNFGDCKENFDYLIRIISKFKDYHIRVLYSALNLLGFFSDSSFEREEFKSFLMNYLKSKDFPISAKSEILRIIQKFNLVKDDSKYMSTIYELFKDETNKQLNNSLLYIIHDEDNIDIYSQFLKHEFLLANGYKKRNDEDEVIRGNRYIINKLILKLSNPNDFLEIFKHYFNNDGKVSYYDNFEDELIEKCSTFIKVDETFIISLLSLINEDYRFHMNRQFLFKIIRKSNVEDVALKYLIENNEIEKIRFFIAELVNENNVNELVEFLINKKISDQEIEYFRNNIGNSNSRDLAVKFNDLMELKGVKFKEPVFTNEKAILYQINYKKHIQENFDILFEKDKLLNEIKIIFENNGNSITGNDIHRIRRDWYDKNGHGNVIDTSISIIDKFIYSRNDNPTTYDEIKEIIENDDFIIITKIRQIIEQYRSSNRDFKISEKQIKSIKEWTLKTIPKIDFNEVAHASGETSFYYLKNYKKVETIFYFQKLFDLELPQEFLLNSIEFYEFDKSGEGDESFKHIFKLINNKTLFDKQIIENLKTKELLGLSMSKHIDYALSNQLEETYSSIRKHFINGKSVFNERKKLEEYIDNTKDISILKELCTNNDDYQFWNSIEIMLKLNVNIAFCKEMAIEYLESGKDRYTINALDVLMKLNDPEAFEFILKSLKKGLTPSFHGIKYSSFDSINNFEDLVELFDIVYNKEIDKFETSYYRDFYKMLITNLSISEENFTRIQAILNQIKQNLIKSDSDLFYINLLIDDSINSHINSKSKPYSLKAAKKKAIRLTS
ncbi:NACHT domain-containing protein [Mangrovimonas sp. AS39]|uniref:NACHT domain-containing protein n=1 Tax=Mangrovimonas futianensis TaxID=2895523 RepID=UPI001E3A5631|nr:NACHT domain-containing protein [Mangrovimonas futianensis]MCF1191745.1 NACHT domain-containing protein [Mangrovimonas futianensis]MCF1195367.1 NACHT domain-containing protein [Mangrovimonas futianensis]